MFSKALNPMTSYFFRFNLGYPFWLLWYSNCVTYYLDSKDISLEHILLSPRASNSTQIFNCNITIKLKRNYSKYSIFNTQFKLLPNLLKNITNYASDSITYTVVSGGNWLSYQKHVQIIHELTRNSITSKVWVFIFIVI